MYLKLWESNGNDNTIFYSVNYARKAIHFHPTWPKGYLRLFKAYHSRNENDFLTIKDYYRNEDLSLSNLVYFCTILCTFM